MLHILVCYIIIVGGCIVAIHGIQNLIRCNRIIRSLNADERYEKEPGSARVRPQYVEPKIIVTTYKIPGV